jgi:HTH-type transcriptional regulator/antitoxin HigA
MQSLNINQTITAWLSITENVFVPHTVVKVTSILTVAV